jgi:hypothetical protein
VAIGTDVNSRDRVVRDDGVDGRGVDVAGLLERTAQVVDDWVALEADGLPVGEVADLLVGYERESARLEAATLGLSGSFARREGYKASGHRSLQQWMQQVLRMSPSTAMRRARTAEQLDGGLDKTRKALREGEISGEHATAIVEAARKLPDDDLAEDRLLAVARDGDAKQVRDVGRRLEHRADAEAARRKAQRAWEQRHLSVRSGADGVTWVDGRLYQLGGEYLATAISDLSAPSGPDDKRSPGQRRADALVELARRHLEGEGGTSGGRSSQVVALVPLEEIEKRSGAKPGSLSWSGPVAPPDLEAAICAAGLDWLIQNVDGRPLHYGRSKRFVQPSQRAALLARDGGCRWPGCDGKAVWAIAHHVIFWDDGGVTDIEVLVLLCPVHHNYVHHGRWTLELHDDACVTVRSPAGTIVRSESAAKARARHLHGHGLETGETGICQTHGTDEADHEKRAADRPGVTRDGAEPAAGSDFEGAQRWTDFRLPGLDDEPATPDTTSDVAREQRPSYRTRPARRGVCASDPRTRTVRVSPGRPGEAARPGGLRRRGPPDR